MYPCYYKTLSALNSLSPSLSCSSGDPAAEEWSQWSVCSLTCGQGWQVRTRSCVSSPYGTLCSGALRETRMCNNTASCPGDPGIIGSGMLGGWMVCRQSNKILEDLGSCLEMYKCLVTFQGDPQSRARIYNSSDYMWIKVTQFCKM